VTPRNDRPGLYALDREILQDLELCLDGELPFSGSFSIRSHHLSVGARVSGAIAERFPDGLRPGQVRLRFVGSAGQSFGAFAVRGVQLDLEGEANDYVGKGLSGGEIAIRPFRQAAYAAASHENQILGNAALYGATSGRLFAAGQAGIRFAVRNSGALAVIEGAGNHACEYMTGGVVVILGRTGRNFAAGMSNGVAYVLDEDETLEARINREMAEPAGITVEDERLLHLLVKEHQRRTGSPRATEILSRWDWYLPLVRKVVSKGEGGRERAEEIRSAWLEKAG
jgi:glutamate synthase domain-containing protein 3